MSSALTAPMRAALRVAKLYCMQIVTSLGIEKKKSKNACARARSAMRCEGGRNETY